MNILDSLLDSIIRLDGDALVLHSGDKPYVIVRASDRHIGSSGDRSSGTAGQRWSQVELSADPMPPDALWRMLRQILPAERCRMLQELGAADYDVRAPGTDEALTLTAVSTGDNDVWVEIRRGRRDTPAPDVEAEAAPRATVVSIARPAPSRQPEAPSVVPDGQVPLEELLRAAAAQSATEVYVVSHAAPMIRVDGKVAPLRQAAAFDTLELEHAIVDAATQIGAAQDAEWEMDVAGVGRVRCVPFTDESGAGVMFELPVPDALLATQNSLEPAVRALTDCADGLVIVAGPRGGGKSTLLDALVDLVNRSRPDHVITIGTRIRNVHTSRSAFVSQRIARGDAAAFSGAARAALREGPDVLVLDGWAAPEVVLAAIDGARAGRLVFMSVAASNVTTAVGRVLGGFTIEHQADIRAALAACLRAIVGQVLLEKQGGGRVAAREILLGSPAVAQLIARGGYARLPLAMQAGRRAGMQTLEEALVSLVRSRAITVAEATRAASDPASLTRALQRENLGTATGA